MDVYFHMQPFIIQTAYFDLIKNHVYERRISMRKFLSRCLVSVMIVLLVMAHVPARNVYADEGQTGEAPVTENTNESPDTADEAAEDNDDASAEAVYDVSDVKSVKAEVKESEEAVKQTAEKQEVIVSEKEKEPQDFIYVHAEIETVNSEGYVYNGKEQTYGGPDTYVIHYYLDKTEVSREDIEALGFDVEVKACHMDGSFDENFYVSGTDHDKYFFDVVVFIKGKVEGYDTKGEYGNTVTLVIEQAPVTVTYKGKDETVTYDAKEHFDPGYDRYIDDDELGLYKEEYIVHKSTADKLITYINVGSYKTGVTQKYLDSTARNTNSNFNVTFVADQGTLKIEEATITVKTESARVMSDGTDTQVLECQKYTAEGYLNEYYDGLFKVTWTGKQVGIGSSLNECVFEVTDENIAANYKIAYEFGTLAIYSEYAVQVVIKPFEDKVPYSGDTQYINIPVEVFIDNPRYGIENIRYNGSNELVLGEKSYLTVAAKDVGDYTFALNAADFENTDSRFEVEFVMEGEALLHVTKASASIVIEEVNEEHLYTGEEFSIPSYRILEINYNDENAPAYDTSNIVFSGKKELKGTDYGMYWEALTEEMFDNTDDNFDVDFVFTSLGNHVSILTITRPGVVVTLKGNEFHVPYDEKNHVLTVNTDGSVSIDTKKQSMPAFEIIDVKADKGVSFNASDLYFRQALTVSGQERGYYNVSNWLNYLSNFNQDIDISYIIEDDIALVVDKTPLTLVIDNLTIRYGDKDELTAHYEGLVDGIDGPKFKLYLKDVVDHIGTYEIFADIVEKSDIYEVTEIKNGFLNVTKRPLTITIEGAKKTIEYDGEKHDLSGYTVTYSEEIKDTIQQPASPVVTGREIGDYELDLSGLDFVFSSSVYDVTVTKINGMLKIVADADPIELGTISYTGGEFVFDGEEHPASFNAAVTKDGKTYTLSGIKFVYYDGEKEIGTSAPVNAGNYTVKVNKKDIRIIDENGFDVTELCEFDVQETADLIITPRPVTVTVKAEKKKIIGGNGNYVYKAGYTVTVEGNPGNSYDFTKEDITYDGQDHAEGQFGGINPPQRYTCRLYLDNFGTSNTNYAPEFKFDGDGLIVLLIRYPGSGAITYLTLDLTSGSTTYNGQPQSFKAEINGLNEDNTIRVQGSDGVYYTVTIDPDRFGTTVTKTGAGEYSATPGSMPNGIVSIEDSSGINCRDTVSFKYTGGTFTINKQVLTVTLRTDVKKTYGEADPDRSTWIIVEGLTEGQSVESLFRIRREAGEDVGEYPFTVSLISTGGGGGGGEVIKDDEKKSAKSVKAVEAVEMLSEYAELIDEEASDEAGDQAAQTNSNITVYYKNTEGKLTINPATVTITAVDDSKWYGTNDPVFTAVITGLVGNEHLPSDFYKEWRDPGEAIRNDYVIHIFADPDNYQNPEYPPIDDPDEPIICLDCAIICDNCYIEVERDYEEVAEYAAKSVRTREAVAADTAERISDKEETVIYVRPEYECEDASMCEELPYHPHDPIPYDPEPIEISTTGGGSGVFKSTNYKFVTKDGLFAILGNSVPPTDPPTDPTVPTKTDPTPDPDPVIEVITTDPAPKTDGPVDITTDPTPTTQPGGRAWALVNLISTVLSCLIAICMIVTIKKRKDEEEEEAYRQEIKDDKEEKEEENDRKRSKLLGLIPSIGSIIAFILTEDMRLPMILVDKWTLLMLILLAVTILLAYFTRHKEKDKEDKGDGLKVEMAS